MTTPTIVDGSGAGFEATRGDKQARFDLQTRLQFREAPGETAKGDGVSRILVIGAAGLIGGEVVKALGESECIRASRNSGERVDISDPKSIAALFDRFGTVDGIVCTGGAARFKPWAELTDDDWTFSLANKLLGQVNVVRYGLKSVRPGGAITLTTGFGVAISRSRKRDHHHRQFRSRRFCPRGRCGAVNLHSGQRRLAGLGRGDPAGDRPQSGRRHSGGRGGRDHRPAVSRRRDGLGGVGGEGLTAPFAAPPVRLEAARLKPFLEEARVVRRSIEAIVAAVDIADRRGGEFFGIKVVQQRNLDGVKCATHRLKLAPPRRPDPASLAKVKLN